MQAVDKQSTNGHCTFLWICQASAVTVVANLLTEMASVLLYRLVVIGYRGMRGKKSVLFGSDFYWLACHAKSEGNIANEKIFF